MDGYWWGLASGLGALALLCLGLALWFWGWRTCAYGLVWAVLRPLAWISDKLRGR
ncbi:MAG: hypothetical protein JW718_05155 [Desulfovibrionaceae bacterium]|nr:hypothetical protein [Desulfovibrionaceae bacterium]